MEVLSLVSNTYQLGRWHYLLLVFICLVPYPCWMLNLVLKPCSSLSVIPTFFDWLMTLSTEAAWPKCRGTSMGYRPLYQLIWPTLITTKIECRPSRLLKLPSDRKWLARGLVEFVPAVAYHRCLNLHAVFSQQRASHLQAPSTVCGNFICIISTTYYLWFRY